ncbi:PREDICTED: sperm-associated antigen 17-like [Dufourea novaeangliae]|uniref:sperm-associated antigen 17-like n=1 Tax=Dufourea novaeangliae TaxID=178035 RepID=UPI00076773D6|nr:PREDICTED: sperm-associated antigen 17-like [Dufourea novaeangliae]
MKKKKVPSKSQASGKGKKQVGEDSWRAELEAISINDDNWWCIVAMMVETTTEHSKYISLFNTAAEEGRRKAIYCLSYQKMMSSVKILSKHSLEKCPTVQGVCHYASRMLFEGSSRLPAWLVARIVKYLIYRIKEKSIGIVKRMADLEHEIDEEYKIMQTVADWGQPGSRAFNAERLNNKRLTKLRKRGEEWRDTIYVDDAPLNGPNLYIILTGFHDPAISEHLVNAGVPLNFILRIKKSKRDLELLAEGDTAMNDFDKTRHLHRFGIYNSSIFELFHFWSKIETWMMDPETHPALLDVAIRVFRPPRFSLVFDDVEYERLKRDMYDNVSYFMYDLYDLYRQHGNYLKSMKLQKLAADDRQEKHDTKIYEALLDSVPQECVSIPLVLFAILAQIDGNRNEELAGGKSEGEDTSDGKIVSLSEIFVVRVDVKQKSRLVRVAMARHFNYDFSQETDALVMGLRTNIDTEVKHETKNQFDSFVEEKLKTLNAKFELDQTDNADDNEETLAEIELILREDTLNETIRLLDDSANSRVTATSNMIDNILPVFWDPRIMSTHAKHGVTVMKLDEYSRHIDKIRGYMSVKVSSEEFRHCLHILMFDRMIFGSTRSRDKSTGRNTKEETTEDPITTKNSRPSMKRSKSVPSLTSKCSRQIHFHSDGNIEYGKVPSSIVDCSPLFEIVDPRETLVPGYLEKNVFSLRYKNEDGLRDFDYMELLPRSIFMQRVQQCLDTFDSFETVYFEPTDSVLLYFSDKWRANGVHEEERMSSIRTSVRLRDFCEYVVAEERDWIHREEQMYRSQTSESLKRLMLKVDEVRDETLMFTDEDFILPWSLKAKDLAKRKLGLLEFYQCQWTLGVYVDFHLLRYKYRLIL